MNPSLRSIAFSAVLVCSLLAPRAMAGVGSCNPPEEIGSEIQETFEGTSISPFLVWNGSGYGLTWRNDRFANFEILFARLDAVGAKIVTDTDCCEEHGSSGCSDSVCEDLVCADHPECCAPLPAEWNSSCVAAAADILECVTTCTGDTRVSINIADSATPVMAWTGSEYGIVWTDARDGNYELYFARVSSTGTRIGPEVRITTDPPNSDPTNSMLPSLVWTGSEYGLAWRDNRDGNDEIYFARLDATGAKIGTDVRLTNQASPSGNPSLVWTGTEYGLAWDDLRDGNSEIYFMRLDASGTKITADLRITSQASPSLQPSLVWDGTAFGVAWQDLRSANRYEIYFTRFDSAGIKLLTPPNDQDKRITNAAAFSVTPSMVWTGFEYGITFYSSRNSNLDIFFNHVNTAGAKLSAQDLRITTENQQQLLPSLAWSGSEYGLAWCDARTQLESIFFGRIGCNCTGDADGDTFSICSDCDDTNFHINPNAPEICDGLDNDCNFLVDFPGEGIDADADSVISCSDCDDSDPGRYPGNPEICNGLDDDCTGAFHVSGLGQNGWFSDDTRADGSGAQLAGTNLVSDTLTDDPEASAVGTPAHDNTIKQLISFGSAPGAVPPGTHPNSVTLSVAASSPPQTGSLGKSQISHRKNDGVGHAPGSVLGPGFTAQYSWMGDGITTTTSAMLKFGVKTSEFGSAPVSTRTGENDWDKLLIYEPANGNGHVSDAAWHTETINYTSGKWWVYDRVTGADSHLTPMLLSIMSVSQVVVSPGKTVSNLYALITAPGAIITSVQFGIGPGQGNSRVHVNQFRTSAYRGGETITLGGQLFVADFPGELFSADGDPEPSCSDCDDLDPEKFPGSGELCNQLDDDCFNSLLVSRLGENGWFSDDTRADGAGLVQPAGVSLVSPTLTDDPEAAAVGNPAHWVDIERQISFGPAPGVVPPGTHPDAVNLEIAAGGTAGKSQISHRKDDGVGHAPGSDLVVDAPGTNFGPDFTAEYSWMGDGLPEATATLKIGIKTAEFVSPTGFHRTGEDDWDKLLIYEPGKNLNTSDGLWYTETIDYATGLWWIFDRLADADTSATPLTLAEMSTSTTVIVSNNPEDVPDRTIAAVFALITQAEEIEEQPPLPPITIPGSIITSISFGIGPDHAGGNVYVNQFRTSVYRENDIMTFGGVQGPFPDFPGESDNPDGDPVPRCGDDCNQSDPAVYPGAPEICDSQINDCDKICDPLVEDCEGDEEDGGEATDDDLDGIFDVCDSCIDLDLDGRGVTLYPANICPEDTCPNLNSPDNTDTDGDGFGDICDSCPLVFNLNQTTDTDHDGIANACDNCPFTVNVSQADTDGDLRGNACDNCPSIPNQSQTNSDGDAFGNSCDNCPTTPSATAQADLDSDGFGNICDNCPSDSNPLQDDTDGDLVGDSCDCCVNSPNPTQANFDEDAEGDVCDMNDGLIYVNFAQTSKLGWQVEQGFNNWNVYAGDLAVLKATGNYTQPPGSNPLAGEACGLTSSQVTLGTPAPGKVAFYLVSGTNLAGEGDLGENSQGQPRPNTGSCPP